MADSNAALRDRLLQRPITSIPYLAASGSKILFSRACLLCGFSFRESTGSAAATAELYSGTTSNGTLVAEIALASGGFDTEPVSAEGILMEGGIFLSIVTGSMVGAVWARR